MCPMDENVLYFRKKARNCVNVYEEIRRLEKQIEEIEYRMNGVSAVDPSKLRGMSSQFSHDSWLLSMSEKKDILELRLDACHKYIDWIMAVIVSCKKEYRPYIVSVYLQRKTVSSQASYDESPLLGFSHALIEEVKQSVTPEMIDKMEQIEKQRKSKRIQYS